MSTAQATQIKKDHPELFKKPKSLSIKIKEISSYDGNPAMRLLLENLVDGTRREKEDYSDTWIPESCPWTAEQMVGWCDMAQWRLAGRIGLTKDHTGKMLRQLETDGWIIIETWRDETTKTDHNRYQVVEAMVDANQRPEWNPRMKSGVRYKAGSRKATSGSFKKGDLNPQRAKKLAAIREEDDE